ncbi:MAG: FkbM family methyltransferase [Kiritimatiellae bacterium]|nr:FkbM family methyltransferase [Kiritimatiellia bacterium]
MSAPLRDAWRRWQLWRHGVRVELDEPVVHAGPDRGAWALVPRGLGAASAIYSFGVGRHIGFDLWIIDHFGATVHAFDPTPAARDWIATQSLPPRFHFHAVGLADFDGEQSFYAPRRPDSPDYSPVPRSARPAAPAARGPVRRLATLMRELGHPRVDLVKMDIEGGEYRVIADLVEMPAAARPIQLLVEFHHNFPSVPMDWTLTAIARLRGAGYRVAHISPRGLEFCFRRDPAEAAR